MTLLNIALLASVDEPCVYRAQFREVESTILTDTPMSRWHVHNLFGFDGRAITDDGLTRVYRGCGEDSRVWLQFAQDDEGTYRAVASAFTWEYFGDGLTTEHPA